MGIQSSGTTRIIIIRVIRVIVFNANHTRKFFAINRFATSAVTTCEVAPLKHEIRDNAMELTALHMQGRCRETNQSKRQCKKKEVQGRKKYREGRCTDKGKAVMENQS